LPTLRCTPWVLSVHECTPLLLLVTQYPPKKPGTCCACPEWATARLQAADASQLEQWADRVLDAPSLEAVFIGY